jgi:hypothetical protein
MDLETRLSELTKRVHEHREVLLTEEAAKNALVMPFLQALGYDVFNPSEVIPEYTCDVGTKKGEKVDYAICMGGSIKMLVECKPVSVDLSVNHASQLFRYFSTTDARVAVLTNGVIYKFFADIDQPNKMDSKPFFEMSLESVRKTDTKTLGGFTKASFDIDKIVEEASKLKKQSLVQKELQEEFANPSDEFVRLIAARVQGGRLTPVIRDTFKTLIVNSFATLVRDQVNARLTTALSASNPPEPEAEAAEESDDGIVTTEEEIAGFHIVRAIAAQKIDPRRVVMRDSKSYCAILLDDNNRKTIVRLHFNSPTNRQLGTFTGKEEIRSRVNDPIDLYQHGEAILKRIEELA